ncbi:MAG TPA: hypothetical protein IAB10_06290 [Candidatus Avilachnospira avistercoris]|nr:hypothetical protein [Candidatus Avilachnospira avistercoris]
MALILCKQRASVPYYYEKLDLRLWSSQELCYLIYNYPLMVSEGFVDEDLCDWLDRELKERELSRKLRQAMEEGENESNLLLMILSGCGYYSRNEINAYMDRLLDISRLDRPGYLHALGKNFFDSGRLETAYQRFEEAMKAADEDMRRAKEPQEKERLLKLKAQSYLDMAVVRILMFEDNKALELILQSELCMKTERSREMKYLLTGESELSEDDKKRLDIAKEDLKLKILSEEDSFGAAAIFKKDSVKAKKEASELLGRLKKEYRRML